MLLLGVLASRLPSTFPAQAEAPSSILGRYQCLFVVGFDGFDQLFKPAQFFFLDLG
jgi:hypothetical protein